MKNMIKVLWYIIVSAMVLTMFVLVSAKVFAHGNGKCLTDKDGKVKLPDDSWVKIIDHLSGDDLDGFAHGHRDQYYDKDDNPTGQAKGFFDINFDDADSDYFADCPLVRTTAEGSHPNTPPPRSPRSSNDASTLTETLDAIIKDPPELPIDIEIPEPPPPPTVIELAYWEYQFYKGWNLMSFSVVPEGVETLADLYYQWTFFAAHNAHIVVLIDNCWILYAGEGETGDIPLSPHMGLAIRLDWSTWLGVRGVRQENSSQIELYAGLNFIGFPQVSESYQRPSDFLSETIIAVLLTQKGKLYLVGRAGDSGDDLLTDGQAVGLMVTQPTTIYLETPQAPMAQRVGTLATSWGGLKR